MKDYLLQDNVDVKVVIDDGNFVLADLHVQLDHVGALLEGVVEAVHRIFEHLLGAISSSGRASSSMSNVQAATLGQLPGLGVASRQTCLDHLLRLDAGVRAGDEVGGWKIKMEDMVGGYMVQSPRATTKERQYL